MLADWLLFIGAVAAIVLLLLAAILPAGQQFIEIALPAAPVFMLAALLLWIVRVIRGKG